MSISSFDAVFYTVGFLVPGFVWSAVMSMMLPPRQTATQTRFLEFLTLSCINHGLWSWALFMIFQTGFIEQHIVWSGWFLFGIIFVSPVGLGIASAALQQRELISRFLSWLGLRAIHHIPQAWDWHFRRAKPYWILVRLKDGSEVYGFFHENSFASSDPARRDIYIEAQFQLTHGGEWAPVEDSGGVLIMGDQIATIEFRKLTEENYDG
jgi:Family of unknown function (DUF6338)